MAHSFRRALGINVVVQSIGAALSFLLALGIAFLWGATAQGQFALIKSWVEFGSLVALAGLPQGFVFAINRQSASASALSRFSLIYCLLSLPFAALGAWVTIRLGYAPDADPVLGVGILAFAVMAYTYHGLVRSILLTRDDGLAFSLFSIAPALLLTLSVIGSMGALPNFYTVFMLSSACVLAVAAFAASRIGFARDAEISRAEWRIIICQSVHSFIVSVLGSAQIVVLYATMRYLGADLAQVGLMSVALLVASAVNVLCTMISPVLYNRWSKQDHSGKLSQLSAQIALASILGALALAAVTSLVLFSAMQLGVRLAADIKAPILILCAALPAILYSRLIIPALFAVGRPTPVTGSSLVRVVLLAPAMFLLCWFGVPVLTSAAIAFAAVEVAGAVWIGGMRGQGARVADAALSIHASKA